MRRLRVQLDDGGPLHLVGVPVSARTVLDAAVHACRLLCTPCLPPTHGLSVWMASESPRVPAVRVPCLQPVEVLREDECISLRWEACTPDNAAVCVPVSWDADAAAAATIELRLPDSSVYSTALVGWEGDGVPSAVSSQRLVVHELTDCASLRSSPRRADTPASSAPRTQPRADHTHAYQGAASGVDAGSALHGSRLSCASDGATSIGSTPVAARGGSAAHDATHAHRVAPLVRHASLCASPAVADARVRTRVLPPPPRPPVGSGDLLPALQHTTPASTPTKPLAASMRTVSPALHDVAVRSGGASAAAEDARCERTGGDASRADDSARAAQEATATTTAAATQAQAHALVDGVASGVAVEKKTRRGKRAGVKHSAASKPASGANAIALTRAPQVHASLTSSSSAQSEHAARVDALQQPRVGVKRKRAEGVPSLDPAARAAATQPRRHAAATAEPTRTAHSSDDEGGGGRSVRGERARAPAAQDVKRRRVADARAAEDARPPTGAPRTHREHWLDSVEVYPDRCAWVRVDVARACRLPAGSVLRADLLEAAAHSFIPTAQHDVYLLLHSVAPGDGAMQAWRLAREAGALRVPRASERCLIECNAIIALAARAQDLALHPAPHRHNNNEAAAEGCEYDARGVCAPAQAAAAAAVREETRYTPTSPPPLSPRAPPPPHPLPLDTRDGDAPALDVLPLPASGGVHARALREVRGGDAATAPSLDAPQAAAHAHAQPSNALRAHHEGAVVSSAVVRAQRSQRAGRRAMAVGPLLSFLARQQPHAHTA